MGTTMEDVIAEVAEQEMWESALLKREKLIQCIYLLVEGDSETVAFPSLLESAGVDLEELGIQLINMKGVTNAPPIVSAIGKTLSSDRPIILVVDNDPEGRQTLRNPTLRQHKELTSVVVPQNKVVECHDGTAGGAFEEMFEFEQIVDNVMEQIEELEEKPTKEVIIERVNQGKGWLKGIECVLRDTIPGFQGIDKVKLAQKLALITPPPRSIRNLAETIKEIRSKHPVLDLYEVV